MLNISNQAHLLLFSFNNRSQFSVKVTPDLQGVLWEKIRMCVILKKNIAIYISLESLINVEFGKKKHELSVP